MTKTPKESVKQCAACLQYLGLGSFSKDANTGDKLKSRCKMCSKLRRPSKRQRAVCLTCGSPASVRSGYCKDHVRQAYNARTGYASYHRYEKTPDGFLMRLYSNMKSRVTGVQRKKFHLYKGLELITRDEFYAWAKSPRFYELYEAWEALGFPSKLTPSVDRANSDKGYTVDNIQWLTHSENSAKGSVSRWNRAA